MMDRLMDPDTDTRSATAACSLVSTGRVTEVTLHDKLLVLEIFPRTDMLPLHERRWCKWRA